MPDLDIPFFWRLREGTSTRKINEPGSKPQLGVGLGTLCLGCQCRASYHGRRCNGPNPQCGHLKPNLQVQLSFQR
jgi:hypothetical protein